MTERLLTVRETGDRLRVSRPTVERFLKRGDLPIVRIGCRAIRIPERAVDALVAERTETLGR